MSKIRLLIAVLAMLAAVRTSSAGDAPASLKTKIGAVVWTEANLETLLSFNKDDVAEFLRSESVDWQSQDMTASYIQEFTWADLAGNAQNYLVKVPYLCGTSGQNWVLIYSRSSFRGVRSQSLGKPLEMLARTMQGVPACSPHGLRRLTHDATLLCSLLAPRGA